MVLGFIRTGELKKQAGSDLPEKRNSRPWGSVGWGPTRKPQQPQTLELNSFGYVCYCGVMWPHAGGKDFSLEAVLV